MARVAPGLHDFPALCLFPSILPGSFIGRFHVKGVGFGPMVSASTLASLTRTVPYAIGHILLTVWGPVVVAMVHAMRTP
jgi:hypothetical protein